MHKPKYQDGKCYTRCQNNIGRQDDCVEDYNFVVPIAGYRGKTHTNKSKTARYERPI